MFPVSVDIHFLLHLGMSDLQLPLCWLCVVGAPRDAPLFSMFSVGRRENSSLLGLCLAESEDFLVGWLVLVVKINAKVEEANHLRERSQILHNLNGKAKL